MLIVVRGIHGFWSVATGPNLQGGALDIGTHIIFFIGVGVEHTAHRRGILVCLRTNC